MASAIEPIRHFTRLLDKRKWDEARDCFDVHRDLIIELFNRLSPRLKADVLALTYGRKGPTSEWQCDLPLLDQILQLDAPVCRRWIGFAYGQELFLDRNGHKEDNTLTPLKIQVLERLSAQMKRVGLVLTPADDEEPVPLTPQTFQQSFNLDVGPRSLLAPERLQLIGLVIQTFGISFNTLPRDMKWLDHELEFQTDGAEFIEFLNQKRWIDWTTRFTYYHGKYTREEWITWMAKEKPDDKRIERLYWLMMQPKQMLTFASGSHKRLGKGSRVGELPMAILGEIHSFLTGNTARPPQ